MSQANSNSSTTQSPQSHTHRAFPAAPQILGGGGAMTAALQVLPLPLALAGLLTLLLPASVWAVDPVTTSRGAITLSDNDNLTVEASGAIVNTAAGGIAVSDGTGTSNNISVTNRGRIEGNSNALNVSSIRLLDNSNTIKSVNSSAIFFTSAISTGAITELINRSGAEISSTAGKGISSNSIGTLINFGTIKGTGDTGVSTGMIGTMVNQKTGMIEGSIGIAGSSIITSLDNKGTIRGNGSTGINMSASTQPNGTLTNSGTIEGRDTGIAIFSSLNRLENSGKITGTRTDGIYVDGRITTLINKGNGEILGGGSTGLGVRATSIDRLENSAKIRGGSNGISVVRGEGHIRILINKDKGEISGGQRGINAGSIGRLENSGKILGAGDNGIWVNATLGRLENSGEISTSGDYNGIRAATINELINKKNGTISGGRFGVYATTGIGTLENFGKISGGAAADGISAVRRINRLLNSGVISSGDDGVQAGSIGVLTNSGRIAGGSSATAAYGIDAGNITTLTNTSTGEISGGAIGISARSIGSLNNSGRITGAANAGVRLTGTDATVTVTNSGTIQGGTYGLNYGNNAITRLQNTTRTSAIRGGSNDALRTASLTTLNNEGTIASTSAAAIALTGTAPGRVTITNSGTIQGATYGLNYGNNAIASLQNNNGTIQGGTRAALSASTLATLNNSGTIASTSAAAITLTGTTTQAATITNTGTIRGGTYGLNYGNNPIASLTNTSPRTLRGGSREALRAGSLLTLNNSGTILSDKASAITLTRTATQAATLTNSGTIQGNIHGLDYNNNAIASLTNSGTIRATTGIGVKAAGLTTLNNTGTIEGQTGIQIARTGTGQAGTTINNAGTLRSLKGSEGTALDLQGPGRDTLNLQAGSTLEGQVRWDGQDDTLHLATGPARLTLIDNNAEPGQAPTPFTVKTNGRPFLLNTTPSTARGQAQTTVTVLDPARIHTRTESTQSQWTGAVFQSLAQQQGTRTGPNARNSTAAVHQALWVRPFGGLHNFKRDGLTPAARYRYGGALAGYAVTSTDWQAGGFVGAAQDTLAARRPGADAEGRHVFAGAYATTRWQALNLKAGLLFGQSRTETEWQRLNNQVTGGQERVVYEGRRYFVSPELGLGTRLTVRGVALEPALSLRYLGLFGAEEAERLVAGREPLRFRAEDRHVGLVRASVGVPLRFPVNAYGGQLYGQLRVGAEGRKRFGGERIEARRGDGVVRFKVADEATVRGFMGAGFEYVVPDLNLSFSADFEASYGSEAVLGVQGQLGFVWGF